MFCGKAYYLRTSHIFVLLFLLYLLSVLYLYIHLLLCPLSCINAFLFTW